MPSSLRRGAIMRKVLLGTAALIALVTPAISADMRARAATFISADKEVQSVEDVLAGDRKSVV